MKIQKVADGAYFVPSYSQQTIAPSFQRPGTNQLIGLWDETADDNEQGEESEPQAIPASKDKAVSG